MPIACPTAVPALATERVTKVVMPIHAGRNRASAFAIRQAIRGGQPMPILRAARRARASGEKGQDASKGRVIRTRIVCMARR